MKKAHPVKVTKVRQEHSATATHKPGQPVRGENYVSQRAESTKKNARKTAAPRKGAKKA